MCWFSKKGVIVFFKNCESVYLRRATTEAVNIFYRRVGLPVFSSCVGCVCGALSLLGCQFRNLFSRSRRDSSCFFLCLVRLLYRRVLHISPSLCQHHRLCRWRLLSWFVQDGVALRGSYLFVSVRYFPHTGLSYDPKRSTKRLMAHYSFPYVENPLFLFPLMADCDRSCIYHT